MNKTKSNRSKRPRIEEQLFAYTSDNSDDVPILSTNIQPNAFTVEDYESTGHGLNADFEVLPDFSNTTSDFSPIISAMEIPNIINQPMSSSNKIPCDTQYVPQNYINYEFDNISSMCSMLSTTHSALNGLLLILRKHSCFSNMPRDSRTLLQTKSIDNNCMRIMDSGKYYHFGLSSGIEHNFQHDVAEIKLVIGIDGLPISNLAYTGLYKTS